PDGNIDFFGRCDDQVKIRGFRIELGEIENKLLTDINVKEAVVIDREKSDAEKYLCAYLVMEQGCKMDTAGIKKNLHDGLPGYMVPSHFVEMERLPLTTNGKIDRKSLSAPMEDTDTLPYFSDEMLRKVRPVVQRKPVGEDILEEEEQKTIILSQWEKRKILYDFNDTRRAYDREKTVAQLFQEQVKRTPHHTALFFKEERLTYGELNEKADALAHTMRAEGAGAGEI
ncbi:MAG: hypothetical protein GY757_50650, partial [bacterium]|nr:hypothetical protein [bacterium]